MFPDFANLKAPMFKKFYALITLMTLQTFDNVRLTYEIYVIVLKI